MNKTEKGNEDSNDAIDCLVRTNRTFCCIPTLHLLGHAPFLAMSDTAIAVVNVVAG